MSGPRAVTAAFVQETGAVFEIGEFEIDSPRSDEVLVRIDAVGMCHADTQARTGALPVPAPLVAGHEGTGVVEEVGAGVSALRPGDRVVLTFDSCGKCDRCRTGAVTQCREFVSRNFTSGRRPDGSARLKGEHGPVNGSFFGQSSFATYALATERNAVAVQTTLPPELLAPLGCGVQTGVGAVIDVLAPRPGDTVVVFGVGAVGLSAVMAATLAGCGVIAVDTRSARLALARRLGAAHTVDATQSDSEERLSDLLHGGAAYVLESSGAPAALASGIRILGPGGTIAVAGAGSMGDTVPLDIVNLVNGSKRIVGVVEGAARPHESIPRLVRLIEEERLHVEEIVSTFPLTAVTAAEQAAHNGEAIKPVLLP